MVDATIFIIKKKYIFNDFTFEFLKLILKFTFTSRQCEHYS